jgi:choice-of-anchor A domain-containing protein
MDRLLFASVGVAASLSVSAASAVGIDAQAMMHAITTITLGDHTAYQHNEGTVFVGGDLIIARDGYYANSDDLPEVTVGGATGALIVGGDLKGGTTSSGGRGNVNVAGSISNTGGVAVSVTTSNDPVPTADVLEAFQALSSNLAGLDASVNGSVQVWSQWDKTIFQGTPADFGSVVFADATFITDGGFNNGFGRTFDTAITTIVNISGSTINIGADLSRFGLTESNVLFNFYEASTINVSNTLNVSVLAPFATVNVLQWGGTKGTFVSKNLNQGSASFAPEMRPHDGDRTNFTGILPDFAAAAPPPAVPLPATGLLLLSGLGGLAALRHRR